MGPRADHIDWVSWLSLEHSARGDERRWPRLPDGPCCANRRPTIANCPMTVNASARMPLNARNDLEAGRDWLSLLLPAGGFALAVQRLQGLRRPHDRHDQVGVGGGPNRKRAPGARDVRVDVCPCQRNPEIRRQRPLPLTMAEDAIENEIAGHLAIVRVLPEPSHRREVARCGNRLACNGVGVAEIPRGSGDLPARAASSLSAPAP
jgi:hypothetical protein